MSQAERDAGFNNVIAVPEALDIVAGWEQRSAALRARYPDHLDLRYGPRERNRIDFFKAARRRADAGVHPWRLLADPRQGELFACLPQGPMAHGINVALIGYTLAPDATLDEIVAEIHAGDRLSRRDNCLRSVATRAHRGVGLVGRRAHDGDGAVASAVKAGMAISGIYDLEPIRHSYLNEKLQARRGDVAAQLADDAGGRPDEAAVAGRRQRRIAAAAQADAPILPAIARSMACR